MSHFLCSPWQRNSSKGLSILVSLSFFHSFQNGFVSSIPKKLASHDQIQWSVVCRYVFLPAFDTNDDSFLKHFFPVGLQGTKYTCSGVSSSLTDCSFSFCFSGCSFLLGGKTRESQAKASEAFSIDTHSLDSLILSGGFKSLLHSDDFQMPISSPALISRLTHPAALSTFPCLSNGHLQLVSAPDF